MQSIRVTQQTKLDVGSLSWETEVEAGILYLTIDRGIKGKQYWKIDGKNTVLLKEEF